LTTTAVVSNMRPYRGGLVEGPGAATEEVRAEGASAAVRPLDDGFDRGERGPAFTVNLCVGRLLEVRIFYLSGPDTLSRLSQRMVTFAKAGAAPAVIFGDYTLASPFSQMVGDAWSRAMRGFNESVAWSALLLARSNETFNLQIERVVRCAGNPGRRLFYDGPELREWVAQRATQAELMRVDELLRTWSLSR
jgi:hypothetical protein